MGDDVRTVEQIDRDIDKRGARIAKLREEIRALNAEKDAALRHAEAQRIAASMTSEQRAALAQVIDPDGVPSSAAAGSV